MNKLLKLIRGAIVMGEYKSNSRDYNSWLFGEWFGKKCTDNCMYLANYVSQNYRDINVYWVAESGTDLSRLNERIIKIDKESDMAKAIYKKVGYVFMNQGYGDFSYNDMNYFLGAITVNLWHGVMWKRIGHDASKRDGWLYEGYVKFYDKIFGSRYYLANSDYYADNCLTAFGAKKNQIIMGGFPRNTLFFSELEIKKAKANIISELNKEKCLNLNSDTKIITYMPTFRDKKENSYSVCELVQDSKFAEWLEKNNIVLVQKSHMITQQRNQMNNTNDYNRVFFLNDVLSQELLAATDVLITDYSSCFFDYLLLNRPIIHFIYDYEYYSKKDRGLYLEKEDVLCGDCVTVPEKLPQIIMENFNFPQKYGELRSDRIKKFMTYDSENACYDLCEKLLKLR